MKTLLFTLLLSSALFAETCNQTHLLVERVHMPTSTGKTYELTMDFSKTITLDSKVFIYSELFANGDTLYTSKDGENIQSFLRDKMYYVYESKIETIGIRCE